MNLLLKQTAHRVDPLPQRRWSVAMRWHDLLFAHWPMPYDALRPFVPPALELDTFEGTAWIGLVPFHMTGVGLRGMPHACGMAFPELNVRTYVRCGGRRGVWFITLDATHRLAIHVARAWYGLPYLHARISVRRDGERIAFSSRRVQRGAPPAALEIEYAPVGPPAPPDSGTLDEWLTERYCLFARDRNGRVHRADIHHAPWPLQPAEAEIRDNSMIAALGLTLPDTPPLLHFARRVDAVAWSPRIESVSRVLSGAER